MKIYKETPPTLQEYYQLFSSIGWMQLLKVSENNLEKVLDNTFYWITAYEEEKLLGLDVFFQTGPYMH